MNIILLVHYTRKLADETISMKKISNGVMKKTIIIIIIIIIWPLPTLNLKTLKRTIKDIMKASFRWTITFMLLIVLAECSHRTLKKNIVSNLKPKQRCQKRQSNKWLFLDFLLWTIFAYQKARSLFNLIVNNQISSHLENEETINMPTNLKWQW